MTLPAGGPADTLCRRFAVLHAFAKDYDWRTWATGLALVAMAAPAMLFFEYWHLFKHPPWLPVALWLATVGGWFLALALQLFLGWGCDWSNKHLDYRALAEALRVQFYWQVSGVPNERAEERYLPSQREKIIKLCYVLYCWNEERHSEPEPAVFEKGEQDKRTPIEWVEAGLKYYKVRAAQDERTMTWLRRVWSWAFPPWLLLVVCTGIFLHVVHHEQELWALRFEVVAALLFITGACCLAYAESRALGEQARSYARMYAIFEIAKCKLSNLKEDDPAKEEVLRQLGQDSLVHNADWLLLHRERPDGPPEPSRRTLDADGQTQARRLTSLSRPTETVASEAVTTAHLWPRCRSRPCGECFKTGPS